METVCIRLERPMTVDEVKLETLKDGRFGGVLALTEELKDVEKAIGLFAIIARHAVKNSRTKDVQFMFQQSGSCGSADPFHELGYISWKEKT